MREIKFRAWTGNSMWMPEYRANWEMLKDVEDEPHAVVMQFTGLHDKNGTEIYEGDIVKAGEANMPIDKYPDYHQVCQVKFGEGAVNGSEWPVDVLGFYLEPHRFKVPNITEAKLEVIGNIYENPELLEEPKL